MPNNAKVAAKYQTRLSYILAAISSLSAPGSHSPDRRSAAFAPKQHQQETDRGTAEMREVRDTPAKEGKPGDAGEQVEHQHARDEVFRRDRDRHKH